SIALHFGADDVNGTLEDERIQHLSGAQTPAGLAREQLFRMIRDAGKIPVERDALYNVVGGTEMAPHTPQRSGRPGEPVAALNSAQRSGRPGEPVAALERIRGKALRGQRLDREEGRYLLGEAPLLEVGALASDVRFARRRFPAVTPHFFTASEIRTMAEVAHLTVEDVLERLWDAGQRTIPGGGAEVLSERVRQRIEPKKGGPEAWLSVHRAAHRRGFKST